MKFIRFFLVCGLGLVVLAFALYTSLLCTGAPRTAKIVFASNRDGNSEIYM